MKEEHRLILLEEIVGEDQFNQAQEYPELADDESEELVFIEEKDITRTRAFTPQQDEKEKRHLPIEGRGRLENLLIVGESQDYKVRVENDEDDIVDDTFSYLETFSNELSHVSAYTKDQYSVVNVSGYPFNERLHFRVTPTSEVTFKLVRAEVIVEEYYE